MRRNLHRYRRFAVYEARPHRGKDFAEERVQQDRTVKAQDSGPPLQYGIRMLAIAEDQMPDRYWNDLSPEGSPTPEIKLD